MKILMLVNWKVKYTDTIPADKQPPDYYVPGQDYWFFRYFQEKPAVDVIDVHSFPWLENFEKETLRFYVWQAIRAIPRLGQYDLIVSHGMQSGVVISLWRRLFRGKARHIVFDIGSFASASESGFALKLMQFASKSIDSIIYHTSSQIEYYQKCFPWIVGKSQFVRFGTDLKFYDPSDLESASDAGTYMLCVGYSKRDWDTLIQAYQLLNTDLKLRLVGHVEEKYSAIPGVEQLPFVPIRDLINQIHNAAFCVLPLESFNYSYGQMTLLQQMALGKCVLAAKVPSLVDYIQDGKTALMYQPGDAADLAAKIRLCLDSKAFCDQIASQGVQYLSQHCNERTMAADIEAVFAKTIM